ncbi:hypothetical protein MMC24_007419 [Lignoscripta atroalba]|nr:hypothetical protein [Lignoscripta atroalba]
MSSNDYSSVTGGSLKLKGVKDSKVEKHKKKKRKRPDKPEDGEDSAAGKRKSTTDPKTRSEEDESILAGIVGGEGTSEEVVIEGEQHQQEQEQEQETPAQQAVDQRPYPEPPSPRTATARKTEAELRHEEQRRRRVRPCLPYSLPLQHSPISPFICHSSPVPRKKHMNFANVRTYNSSPTASNAKAQKHTKSASKTSIAI